MNPTETTWGSSRWIFSRNTRSLKENPVLILKGNPEVILEDGNPRRNSYMNPHNNPWGIPGATPARIREGFAGRIPNEIHKWIKSGISGAIWRGYIEEIFWNSQKALKNEEESNTEFLEGFEKLFLKEFQEKSKKKSFRDLRRNVKEISELLSQKQFQK